MDQAGWLKAEIERADALAKKYRDSLERAKKIGKPYPDGTYRGPYGNARDPIRGHHYSPRIIREAIKAETKAAHLREILALIAP